MLNQQMVILRKPVLAAGHGKFRKADGLALVVAEAATKLLG